MLGLFEHGLKRVRSNPCLMRLQHTAHTRFQRDATEGKERCFSNRPRSTFSSVIVLLSQGKPTACSGRGQETLEE